MIKVHLKRSQFDGVGRPTRWTPANGVVIDPEVQAGAPCVEGTRIPTRVVAEQAAVEPDDDIAFDLDLEPSAIEAAILFEELRAKGTGGPAFIRALIPDADNRPINVSSKRRHPSTRQKRVG